MTDSKKRKSSETNPSVVSLWRAILWLVAAVYAFFFLSGLMVVWINPVLSSRGATEIISIMVILTLVAPPLSLIAGLVYGWVAPYIIFDAILKLRQEVKPHLEAGYTCGGYDVDYLYYVYAPGTLAVFVFAIFVLTRRRLPIWLIIAFVLAGSSAWHIYLHRTVDQVRALPENTEKCGG